MTGSDSMPELLIRFLDGQLSERQEDRVVALLEDDREARAFFRAVAEQAVSLDDFCRSEETRQERAVSRNISVDSKSPSARRRRRMLGFRFFAVAVVASILVGTFLFSRRPTATGIGYVTGIEGAVRWNPESGGAHDVSLELGQSVRNGVLESLSSKSWVELKFEDDTTLTIPGKAALSIAADGQKKLGLSYGSLSTTVARQPQDRPMLIQTPCALVVVRGTQLTVRTDDSATLVVVNSGVVEVTRLTDGKVVRIPAGSRATVSNDANDVLESTIGGEMLFTWSSKFPADIAKGKFRPGDATSPQGVQADLHVSHSNGELVRRYTTELVVSRNETMSVRFSDGSRIRVLGHFGDGAPIQVGVSVRVGDVVEKYATSIAPNSLAGDVDELLIPIGDLRSVHVGGESPVGQELLSWWCHSSSPDLVTKVELIPGKD